MSQLEGPELGSEVLVPPPPGRDVPLVPTARVTKQAREKGNELAAAAFLFLASNTPFGWPFLLLLVLHLLF